MTDTNSSQQRPADSRPRRWRFAAVSLAALGIISCASSGFAQDKTAMPNPDNYDIVGLRLGMNAEQAFNAFKRYNKDMHRQYSFSRPDEIYNYGELGSFKDAKESILGNITTPMDDGGFLLALRAVDYDGKDECTNPANMVIGNSSPYPDLMRGVYQEPPKKTSLSKCEHVTAVITPNKGSEAIAGVFREFEYIKDAPAVKTLEDSLFEKFGNKVSDKRVSDVGEVIVWQYDGVGHLVKAGNQSYTHCAAGMQLNAAIPMGISSVCDGTTVVAAIYTSSTSPLVAKSFYVSMFNQAKLYQLIGDRKKAGDDHMKQKVLEDAGHANKDKPKM